ncbi:MAG: hypothetical protein RL030_1695 [Pseudomonadota bacterium]|jgi:hypothetical protein
MNISRDEAGEALTAVFDTDRRARQFQGARSASPYLILWGVVWFFANGVTGLAPQQAGTAWLVATVVGVLATIAITVRQTLHRRAMNLHSAAESAAIGRRAAILGTTVIAFFPATLAVLAPLEPMKGSAFISLFFAFAYMASGAWLGLRMFVAGLVTAVAVLVGYLIFPQYYYLWMAVVGGGSLMLAGLWLRQP